MNDENRHSSSEPESAPTSTEGNLVAAPPLPETTEAGAVPDKMERRARGQVLTGRAAELSTLSLSPTGLAWRQLKKNRVAMWGMWTLIVLYTMALLAPFLAPYDPAEQLVMASGRTTSYHPPTKMRWRESNGTWHKRPFIYLTVSARDEFRRLTYLPDPNQPRVIRWFVQGAPYKLFGIIPMRTHLFGLEGDNRIFLLGTDEVGRDNFSRLLYGSQISLSVGLIAIAISFSLGMLMGGISGFYGGRIDDFIMRGSEILMSVPDFYLLLTL
ncbi:MAG TPA: hypothetical protein VF719_03925, partial [Abditibacteriaceae bacterium]